MKLAHLAGVKNPTAMARPEGLMAVPMTERDGALVAGTPQTFFAMKALSTGWLK